MKTTTKIFVAIIATGMFAYLAFGFFGVQALFIDTTVDEAVPVAVDSRVASGIFQQGDSTYTIRGNVQVTQQGNVQTLAFTDFSVTNGPDLFVYLVNERDPSNDSVKNAVEEGRFVNLGALKGNIGNQTYVLPEGVTVKETSVISIWCRRFSRNFGAALLKL